MGGGIGVMAPNCGLAPKFLPQLFTHYVQYITGVIAPQVV